MCKCVLVLKITKNLYIVVVMLLCAKIKKKMTSVKGILTVNIVDVEESPKKEVKF